MANLAVDCAGMGQNKRALGLREEVVALRKARLGPDHRDTIPALDELTWSLADAGRFDRAEPIYRAVVAATRTSGDRERLARDLRGLVTAA